MFTRTAGTLPIAAIAALLGGAIGGFSVYAVSLALTDTPMLPHEAAGQIADNSPQHAASPIRTIGTPPPNVTEQIQAIPAPQTATPETPTPQSPTAQGSQGQTAQSPWPDALSRSHAAPSQPEATAETPPPVAAPPAASETVAASKPEPLKPAMQKRRVVARKPLSAPNRTDETAARSQAVYDYYDDDRDGDAVSGQRAGNSAPLDLNWLARAARHTRSARVVIRRGSEDQSELPQREARPMLPPQPPPPGLFGGDRDDGWR